MTEDGWVMKWDERKNVYDCGCDFVKKWKKKKKTNATRRNAKNPYLILLWPEMPTGDKTRDWRWAINRERGGLGRDLCEGRDGEWGDG
jgi:hypothetical protein